MKFKSKKPHYEYLRKKWVHRNQVSSENLFSKHLKKIAATSLGGLMLLTTPGLPTSTLPTNQVRNDSVKITGAKSKNVEVATALKDKVPAEVRSLEPEEEAQIATILGSSLGIKVTAEIDGKRLNRSYGFIGGEQHLYRYPGDTVFAHSHNVMDWAMFGGAGIAPGLGAWGYFTSSKQAFTRQDEERERWYIAVQTFLSPGFSERTAEHREFFKYRKMLVTNPKTGQSVVTDIADAGPGETTGKHLGGSPEVMHELGLATGPRKGAVLYFFIDDPNGTVPLGPIKGQDELLAGQ